MIHPEHECTFVTIPLALWGQQYCPPEPAPPHRPDLVSTGRNQTFNSFFKIEACSLCGLLRLPDEIRKRLVDAEALAYKERRK